MARAKKRRSKKRRLHREPVVRKIAALLETGTPTKWRWTSEAHHGLRAAMCMSGIAWEAADKVAAEVVTLARHRIGLSQYPSWIEARGPTPEQREYFFCASCSGFMQDGSSSPWCSDECRSALQARQRNETGRRGAEARQRATRTILTGGAEPPPAALERSCRKCNKLFKAKKPHQWFCGHVCAAKKERYRRTECLICAEPFQPYQHKQLTCGPSCSWKLTLKRLRSRHVKRSYEKQCRTCAQAFTAARSTTVLCSEACQRVDNRRRGQAWSQKRARAAVALDAAAQAQPAAIDPQPARKPEFQVIIY